MKKIIFALALVIVAFMGWFYTRHPLGSKAIINGHVINIELAISEAEKEQGLGDRSSLPKNAGMLFLYQNKDKYGFWMKGMRFPLDFIWIDGNIIVDLSQNIPAPTSPREEPYTLSPSRQVDKVLEVNAGTIQSLGIKIGDTVKFTN